MYVDTLDIMQHMANLRKWRGVNVFVSTHPQLIATSLHTFHSWRFSSAPPVTITDTLIVPFDKRLIVRKCICTQTLCEE